MGQYMYFWSRQIFIFGLKMSNMFNVKHFLQSNFLVEFDGIRYITFVAIKLQKPLITNIDVLIAISTFSNTSLFEYSKIGYIEI